MKRSSGWSAWLLPRCIALLGRGLDRLEDARCRIWFKTADEFKFQVEVASLLLAWNVAGPSHGCECCPARAGRCLDGLDAAPCPRVVLAGFEDEAVVTELPSREASGREHPPPALLGRSDSSAVMSDKLVAMVREETQRSGPDHRQRLLEPMRVESLAEPGVTPHLRRDGGAGQRQEEHGGGLDGPGRMVHGRRLDDDLRWGGTALGHRPSGPLEQ